MTEDYKAERLSKCEESCVDGSCAICRLKNADLERVTMMYDDRIKLEIEALNLKINLMSKAIVHIISDIDMIAKNMINLVDIIPKDGS